MRFLFLTGFLLGSLTCGAAGSTDPVQTLFGTNFILGIRQPALSGVLSDAQFDMVIRASRPRDDRFAFTPRPVRLSLDLPLSEPLAPSGEFPLRADPNISPNVPPEQRASSIESAERGNVEAMRDYRERWKKFLDEFSPRPVPILYPSTIQRTLENTSR